jgi:two-component system, OmpR family, sensor histidine kinase KdpD
MDLNDDRPNPDELLASLISQEEKSKKGKLKIFFGMCAGVGKTYTMLQTAHAEKLKNCDIIIGYVETHKRKETAELAEGFELIPRKTFQYKTAMVQEMDLDAIITRNPQVVIVDELAHTNAPGSRHKKRYHDVLEILENGINVYTTLNVQHLESRSDTVAQITGIVVRETVPDEIFENADEVEVIDLTPDDLLKRLAEGKVYTPDQTEEAIANFFRVGNINALREMALRIVADRVDKQLHEYLQRERIKGPWKSGLHLLVAIDYKQHSTRLLRWAKTLAYSMDANIQALYVETLHKLSPKEREQLDKNIKLAKQLGIKLRIITFHDVVKAIVNFAQKENITHIIVGKPRVRNFLSMFRLSNFIRRLIRYSGNIDVYILGNDRRAKDHFTGKGSLLSFTSNINQYVIVTALILLLSFACFLIRDIIDYQIVSFGLLFLISILAIFYGRGPILLAAALSAIIWDYFFIPPRLTLYIGKPQDLLMLIMFFIIALLNGILTTRVRLQEKKIRIREARTDALYQLTKEMTMVLGIEDSTKTAVNYIHKYFNLDCAIILKNETEALSNKIQNETKIMLSENELSIAAWVYKHSSKAGKHTDTLPSGDFTIYPLVANSGNMGIIAVELKTPFTQGEEQFWEAFLTQISNKYEREYLRIAARIAYFRNESGKLYKTLFDSILLELRGPVTTIRETSAELLAHDSSVDSNDILYSAIETASERLNRLLENLLHMSKLESGQIIPQPGWCNVQDMANNITESLSKELQPFRFSIVIPVSMPAVWIDAGLIEQVLFNLVLNATQHAPPGSIIRLKFFYDNGFLSIMVMDRGKGFSPADLTTVFDKYTPGKDTKAATSGLRLPVVKGFVEAHKGTIIASNRTNGGAIFEVKIPADNQKQILN